ncbi:MAG: M23 family metallopeptidase [Alistipes sp.]|nr:M23 family metallopeptidase [Alistipes sp.]
MKRLFENIKGWFRKKRFSMSDPAEGRDNWSVHISPAGLLGSMVAFGIFLFLLVLILVAYTPILDIFPGYRTAAERSHDALVEEVMRIDSLERRMNDMLVYSENVAMIMDGRTPVVRSQMLENDTIKLDKTLVKPSTLDSLLRSQMEGEGEYSLAKTLASQGAEGRSKVFAAPVEGIITRHFSREDSYLGVGIQAAPNAPVTSIDEGVVVDVASNNDMGTTVTVQHFDGYISVYRNLTQVLVDKGQTLKARQVIGYNSMPQVGDMDNPIFELEIWHEGKAVDPEIYIVF